MASDFLFSNLRGVKWYLVLIYISLITNEVKHLFVDLLVIQVSPSVNCLFVSYAHLVFCQIPCLFLKAILKEFFVYYKYLFCVDFEYYK